MKSLFFKCLILLLEASLAFVYFSHVAVAEITNKQISKYYNSIVSVNARVPSDAITARSLGTEREGNGVIIDDNRILTIGYIITEASEIEIGLADGTKLPAVMVGYDHSSGFGIIKPVFHVELEGLKLGDSDKIQLDEPLLIMPSKQRGIGSVAKMVSRRPFSGWWEYYLDKPIFTFPVNNDWGGTPLLNSRGEVLGIGSLFVQDAASEGTFSPGNMFVPINLLKPILKDLIKFGRRQSDIKPYLGITSRQSSGSVYVSRVREDGPAFKAGIQPEDIIKSVNGISITTLQNFYQEIWKSGNAGVAIKLGIDRNNQLLELTVKTVDRLDLLTKQKSF